MKAMALEVQKSAIRKWGCPVCGVRHRHGMACKPFRYKGLMEHIRVGQP